MIQSGSCMPNRPIIITRNLHAGQRTAAQLHAVGIAQNQIWFAPLVNIAFNRLKIELDAGHSAIFTSQNGVHALTSKPPKGMTAWCVGERTAEVARRKGFAAIAAEGNAESLIARLQKSDPKNPLIWYRGKHTAVDIEEQLSRLGMNIRSEIVYQQYELRLSGEAQKLLKTVPCVLPIFSPRTAAILSREAAGFPNRGHIICCLGRRTKEACRLNWQKEIATGAESLIQMTVNWSIRCDGKPNPN